MLHQSNILIIAVSLHFSLSHPLCRSLSVYVSVRGGVECSCMFFALILLAADIVNAEREKETVETVPILCYQRKNEKPRMKIKRIL